MENVLEISLHSLNEKVKFSAVAGSNPEIIIDYYSPIGDDEGYTSLELLLISFASCVSSTLLTLLRNKMGKSVHALKVNAKGYRRDTHPKSFHKIDLFFELKSEDVEEEELKKFMVVAEEKLCPVWDMLKGNVLVYTHYKIIK